MAHTCRGTISLHGAAIHCEDSCNFIISNVSNGGTQTFHLKTPNEIERQRWITALELAKAKAIRALDSGEIWLGRGDLEMCCGQWAQRLSVGG